MKNYKYTSKLRLWVEFCSEFSMVNDIEIHQLNLRPFKKLKFFDENPINFIYFFIC
jgi:phage terminase large subunit